MIRVVSFDIDDTLYDFWSASARALEFVAARMRAETGDGATGPDAREVIGDLIVEADEMANPCVCLPELRRRAFARTLKRHGLNSAALPEELNGIYLAHRFENLTLFPGAREMVEEIARSYRVVSVSNGEQDIAQFGLERHFDFVLLARDAGVDKPDPRIFRMAMDRAGCAPEEFVHVGDSESSDVAGAKSAGALAVWFNPQGRPPRLTVRADAVAQTPAEVVAAVRRLDRACA